MPTLLLCTSQYAYQIHDPSYISSKNISPDSQNDVSEQNFNAISKGGEIQLKLLRESNIFHLYCLKDGISHYKLKY
jgi:hypothetical protein